MRTFKYTFAATTAISLETILGDTRGVSVILQAESTNVGNVFIGDHAAQLIFLPSSASTDLLPIQSTKNVFVRSAIGNVVIILLLGV